MQLPLCNARNEHTEVFGGLDLLLLYMGSDIELN